MGRRAHKPDPALRRQVEAMAAYGIPEEQYLPGERLVITAGLKLIVVPIDSTWTRRSLAGGSRARLPTPAEPVRVAPASASRSGPVPRVGAPERRW
jgi:hypothetical protein